MQGPYALNAKELMEQSPPPSPGSSDPGSAPLPAAAAPGGAVAYQSAPVNIYDPNVDVSQVLTEPQRQQLAQNTMTQFSPVAAAVLHVVTLGLFTTIYHGLKLSKMPLAKQDDFTAGKGIGFLFIPYFNIYWFFKFWGSIVDRINFQHRLRGNPPPLSKGLILVLMIFGGLLIPGAIATSMLQNATNEIAAGS